MKPYVLDEWMASPTTEIRKVITKTFPLETQKVIGVKLIRRKWPGR